MAVREEGSSQQDAVVVRGEVEVARPNERPPTRRWRRIAIARVSCLAREAEAVGRRGVWTEGSREEQGGGSGGGDGGEHRPRHGRHLFVVFVVTTAIVSMEGEMWRVGCVAWRGVAWRGVAVSPFLSLWGGGGGGGWWCHDGVWCVAGRVRFWSMAWI